jgi:O-acetyl-ADP-ribose deacetylase (regulator of RNase III)
MIHYTTGNLLEADVEAMVNAVNTVGVMGKGIALQFKQRFPENYRQYEAACKAGQVVTGTMFVTEVNELIGPRWIINFPTKQHWRDPSQLTWIKTGLKELSRVLTDHGIRSVAIPALGAGNGGLDWALVRPLIEQALGDLEAEVIVYQPRPSC